ncbi:MAG: hypothetical protein AABX85_03345 [Nanoarchaeota archaeon]
MKEIKRFDEFIKNGIVKKVKHNQSRVIDLKAKAEKKKASLQERIDKIELTEGNAEDYVESCYDIIMLCIRAKMLSNGYKASGLGAHEAEVSYLRNLGFSEKEIQFADQLRYFRNGMLYYGTTLDKEYVQKVLEFFNQIYSKLKKLLEK